VDGAPLGGSLIIQYSLFILLGASLAGLSLNMFLCILDALAFVRLGRPNSSDRRCCKA
jgi:hypothetical protein